MLKSLPFFPAISLAVALGLLSATNCARADMAAPAESQRIQQRLDAVGQHFHGRQLARWSDPEAQKALKGLWDPVLLGQPPYSSKDVTALVTLLKAQESVLQMYTGAGHAVPGSPKEAVVRTKYQDEIVRSSAFLAATSAALLQAFGDFAAKLKPEQLNAERRHSIDEGRSGVRSLIESFNAELQLPDVTAANKALLLDALAANAETIAAYSPDADRKRYARAANAVLAHLPDAEKAKLRTFIAAMDTKVCKGLCTLGG